MKTAYPDHPLDPEDAPNYNSERQNWRDAVARYFQQIEAIIIATIKSVYGVTDDLSDEFLGELAFRAFFRWAFGTEFWMPDTMSQSQKEFANKLAEIIEVNTNQIKYWTVQKLLDTINPSAWQRLQPYMRTPLIYWQNPKFREQVVKQPNFLKIIRLVRELWDKAGLVRFLQEQGADEFIPPHTEIFDQWELSQRRENLISSAKERYKECKERNSQGFVVRAWEWASGGKMIIVKCKGDQIIANWKEITNEEDLIKAIETAIPPKSRYIEGILDWEKREPDKKVPQNFLIQNLIPLTQDQRPDENLRKESSINFFIDPESWNINLIATTANIAKWGVHQGNIEMVLPYKVVKKLTQLAQKFQQYWYRGPLGFDFAWKWTTNWDVEIVIFEANTRFTAPWSGAMLAHKLRNKFDGYPDFALNQHCEECDIDLPSQISWPTSTVPFSPPTKSEQGIIVLGKNPWDKIKDIMWNSTRKIAEALIK